MTWITSFSKIESVKKDTLDSGVENLEDKKAMTCKAKTMQVIKDITCFGLPKNGEQLRLISFRSFNASLFLEKIACDEEIEELILVVYSINSDAAFLIDRLVKEKRIVKATILMSNLRNKAHRSKEQITRDLFVDNPNIELFFASSHAKIMCFKTKKGNHYTVEGSGNLSYNSRIEQYTIDNCEEIFSFHKHWTQEVKKYLKGKKELVLT